MNERKRVMVWLLMLCLWLGLDGVILTAQGQKQDGNHSKIACHGDAVTIQCISGAEIQITDAIYKRLDDAASFCRNTNNASTVNCQGQPLRERISTLCKGKDVCQLSEDIVNSVQNECKTSLYLRVSYNCVRPPPRIAENPIFPTSSEPENSTLSRLPVGRKTSMYLQLVYLFMEIRTLPLVIGRGPRKAALCLILSLAAGMLVLILYLLLLACCQRCQQRRRQKQKQVELADDEDEADGVKSALLISSPTAVTTPQLQHAHQPVQYETVLVTRQNGVPLHETTISSDSTLLTRGRSKKRGGSTSTGHAEVISTIKRTHSVDEGTQTDNEDMESVSDLHHPSYQRTLSVQEAIELGSLVDDLNYYNSRIDDDDAFYPQFSGNHFQSKSHCNTKENTINKYYYANRGPSFDDEGRSGSSSFVSDNRQPLLLGQQQHSHTLPSKTSVPQQHPYYVNHYNRQKSTGSRNASELSYATSNASDQSADAILTLSNDYNSREDSIRRTHKPGVRGDGYEFIVNSSSRSNSSR